MKNRGVSWGDLQGMTLRQAEFIAVAGVVDEDAQTDYDINKKIAFLENVADARGVTIYQFGQLGAEKIAEICAAFTGTPITAGDVQPLLIHDEFVTP